MTLEKYRSGGSLRYRLDGKRISASQAKEILASNPDVTLVDNSVITREETTETASADNVVRFEVGKTYKVWGYTTCYETTRRDEKSVTLKDEHGKEKTYKKLDVVGDTEYLSVARNIQLSASYKFDGTLAEYKAFSKKDYAEWLAKRDSEESVDDDSVITRELCPDRLAAIKQIEAATQTTFFVDHTVKIEGGVFAQDDNGATLELRNDSVSFKTASGKVTIFELDIPESKFIDALNCATIDALDNSHELETFTITGNSGKVYTYDANTLEVISVDEPVVESEESEVPAVEAPAEKLVDFIINQRRSIQAAFIKNRPAKVA